MSQPQIEHAKYDRYWRLNVRLPDRKGHRCRLISRGTMNSAVIEFEDGVRHVVSRNAFRKLPAPTRLASTDSPAQQTDEGIVA